MTNNWKTTNCLFLKSFIAGRKCFEHFSILFDNFAAPRSSFIASLCIWLMSQAPYFVYLCIQIFAQHYLQLNVF